MWAFFSRRLRMWLLLAIALPLIQALVHRLALAAERHDPSTRTARTLLQADSAVGAVSLRAARRQTRRRERGTLTPVAPDVPTPPGRPGGLARKHGREAGNDHLAASGVSTMRPLSARLSIRWWAVTASSNGSTSIPV